MKDREEAAIEEIEGMSEAEEKARSEVYEAALASLEGAGRQIWRKGIGFRARPYEKAIAQRKQVKHNRAIKKARKPKKKEA